MISVRVVIVITCPGRQET